MRLIAYDIAIWFLKNIWSRRLPLKFEIGICFYCLVNSLHNFIQCAINAELHDKYLNYAITSLIFGVIILVVSLYHDAYLVEKTNYEKTYEYKNNEEKLERFERDLRYYTHNG